MSNKIILGIETSCDDTSVCLLQGSVDDFPKVLSHLSYSQIEELADWGGVVPEIAARNHLQKITPLLKQSFEQANITPKDLDLIAVTTLPGLLGPLLTGLSAAKTLALTHQLPILAVNHLHAHLEAIHLTKKVNYPYLGLLVSGGHSLYIIVESSESFEIIGSTIDDAAGEAFDKGGKLLGLGYPAGRVIDELAKKIAPKDFIHSFPIGLKGSKNAYLSFSGVKSTLRDLIKKENIDLGDSELIKNICASYQHAIVEALARKLKYALMQAKVNLQVESLPIVVGGGVACNSKLRERLSETFEDVSFVAPKYCTDNGAMIANMGLLQFSNQIAFPKCLELDSRGKFIDKSHFKNLASK